MSANFLSDNLLWIAISIATPVGLVIFFSLRTLHRTVWHGVDRLLSSARILRQNLMRLPHVILKTAVQGVGLTAILAMLLLVFVQYFFIPLLIILLLVVIF